MDPTIATVLSGIGGGVAYSLATYSKKQGQDFDWKKFGTTVALGAITGVLTVFTGWEASVQYTALVNAGAVGILESVGKALWRKILGPAVVKYL